MRKSVFSLLVAAVCCIAWGCDRSSNPSVPSNSSDNTPPPATTGSDGANKSVGDQSNLVKVTLSVPNMT